MGGCFGELADGDGNCGSGSGAFIASASEDGDIVLWDVKSKEIVQRIARAHKEICLWVDVHGDTMVSAGKDGVIRVFKNKVAKKTIGDGDAVNGAGTGTDTDTDLNGANKPAEESDTPDVHAADDELQRHMAAEDTSHIKQEGVKVEEP